MGLPYELAHFLSDPDCPDHGSRTVYDHNFRSLRCAWCGHRFSRGDRTVTPTRKLPVWMWPKEASGRAWAKQTRGKSRAQARGLSSR